ncbi:MAG TPA: NAD(+) diphosphatase [Dehalococcoidia bacterium]|nr:NAD(+) diphosphatase [Dehalococcoidia bacterium]
MPGQITFSGNPLDRAGNQRKDAAWLEAQLRTPDARFLPMWRLNVLTLETEAPSLLWLDGSVLAHASEGVKPVLLGLRDGTPHWAVDISHLDDPAIELGLAENAKFAEARAIAGRLEAGEAGIVAQARAQMYWHERHRFCSVCGNPSESHDGGSVRKCPKCEAEHFPRTDPAVIMVVWQGDRCILGRQKAWPAGFFSSLAGFVDQGETIEEAVRREVMEEAGIEVDDVEYVASQPWPFPASLMIGCFAHAKSDVLNVDTFELDAARWFTRDEVREAVEKSMASQGLRGANPGEGFAIPGPMAIAHHIIKAWSERA